MGCDQQMTISELKEKKWELIENMETLIKDFMTDTGVSVEEVYYCVSKTFGGDPADFKVSMKVELDVGF